MRMKQKVTKTKLDMAAPAKLQPKVKTKWQLVAGQPSPLYRKLWSRLLQVKREDPPTGGDEGEKEKSL